MGKLNLNQWAAAAEIIGTTAIIISLLFVAYSINQNTAVTQAGNDNFIYELQYARIRDVVSSPGMASIYVKSRRNEELSEVEHERLYWDRLQELGTWEIAYKRHRDGLFSSTQWDGWNNFYIRDFSNRFSAESWEEIRDWYSEDFKSHIDAIYANK